MTLPGGDLEYAVLAALWDLGLGSARDVHGRVGEPRGLVYTTITKVLDRLCDKGLIRRKKAGRAFVYQARVARGAVDQARARSVLAQMFGREPRPAMAALVDAVEAVDPRLLEELGRLVAARRRAGRGS